MINCPNCNEKMNERFEYCRICGYELNGEKLGDYSTEIINLFEDSEGYYYLFAVNGKQVILRGKDKKEIKEEVLMRNYPWIEKKESEKNENNIESDQENQIITTPKIEPKEENQTEETQEKQFNTDFKDEFAYVTKEEDVNFGKIKYYDPESGQGMETWGPDNSERAKNLRKKILGKYV